MNYEDSLKSAHFQWVRGEISEKLCSEGVQRSQIVALGVLIWVEGAEIFTVVKDQSRLALFTCSSTKSMERDWRTGA